MWRVATPRRAARLSQRARLRRPASRDSKPPERPLRERVAACPQRSPPRTASRPPSRPGRPRQGAPAPDGAAPRPAQRAVTRGLHNHCLEQDDGLVGRGARQGQVVRGQRKLRRWPSRPGDTRFPVRAHSATSFEHVWRVEDMVSSGLRKIHDQPKLGFGIRSTLPGGEFSKIFDLVLGSERGC